MESYKVIFRGRVAEGKDTVKLGLLLAKFLKLPASKADQLFNGKVYALKKNLNHEKAKLIQDKLLSLGVITDVVKEIPISENPSLQEELKTDVGSAEYEMLVDGKKCCKHCGSNLEKQPTTGHNSAEPKLSNIDAESIKDKLKGTGNGISNEIKTLTEQKGIKGLLTSPLGLILCSTIVLFGFIFASSISSIPSCSSGEVKDVVVDIARREMIKKYGAQFEAQFSYSVLMIRNVGTNESTGAHACASSFELVSSITNKTAQLPIEYTVEGIEGEDGFYVNVSGLSAL